MILTHRAVKTRRGTTLVESTLIFLVFFLLILGMLDLGTAAMQMHLLTDAARQVSRQARVRGELADVLEAWGPATVGPVSAGGSHGACAVLRDSLPGFDPDTVTLLLEWPDGGNAEGMRVRVSLTATHRMVLPQFVGGRTSIDLQATSTTPISH